jgi:hypothetical protein
VIINNVKSLVCHPERSEGSLFDLPHRADDELVGIPRRSFA